MNFVFIDIDGVLNHSKTTELCGKYRGISDANLKNLKKIVTISKAKIVLVSSWKRWWFKEKELKNNQDILANYLDEKFNHFGITIFDKIDSEFLDRGKSIKSFLIKYKRNNSINNFVILDDQIYDYKEEKLTNNLVLTSFYTYGLNKNKTNEAITKLIANNPSDLRSNK